jgi:hypothetical protein
MFGLDKKAAQGFGDPLTLLNEVAGPTAEELATGRRLMLTRLAQLREASVKRRRRGLMKPAGAIAALLTFGVFAAGAAAAGGVISAGSVLDLLQENNVSVPGAAHNHLNGLPKADLPDLPSAVDSSAGLQGQGLGDPADAAAHGEATSSAVSEAIAANEAGQGMGAAVSEAACNAATNRSDLPAQAQGHGPADLPVDCAGLGAASVGSNGVSSNAGVNQGKPPVSVPPSALVSGSAGDNPVGAPPDGAGTGSPPVGAPPSPPGLPEGIPPVAAPPSDVGQGNPPSEIGSPVQPPLPNQAEPPVDPGTPGTPVDLPPPPPGGKPSGIPTPPPH